MNGVSLFTGSAIQDLTLKQIIPDYRTIAYLEKEPYCIAQIIARISDGVIDDAPIFDDVRDFDCKPFIGKVDFITAGFPCQPFSVAGKGKAENDERNMWPDTIRIISELRPSYAFLENVPNLLTHKYIRRIFGDLAKIGYDCEWHVVSAAEVGAWHLRKRVWILAYPRLLRQTINEKQTTGLEQLCEDVTLPKSKRAGADNKGFWERACGTNRGEDTTISNTNQLRKSQPERSEQIIGGRSGNGSQEVSDSSSSRSEVGLSGSINGEKGQPEKFNNRSDRSTGRSGSSYWSVESDLGRMVDGLASLLEQIKAFRYGVV